MTLNTTSRTRGQALFLAVVLVVSAVAIGATGAAAQLSASEEPNTEHTVSDADVLESVDRVDLSEDGVIADGLEREDGEVVLLLAVERDIDSAALDAGQVDAETLQADSEATLGPVAETVAEMEAAEVRHQFWVGNVISVTADLGVHSPEEFARIDGVTGVTPNVEFSHPAPVESNPAVSVDQNGNYTYGLEQIDVPGFDDKYGDMGGNATVSIIDNGISNPEEGHPDLEFAIEAIAANGNVTTGTLGSAGSHGEHTAGTATGAADPAGDVPRYGVAPEADLIKINSFEEGAAGEDILASVQFSVEEDADVASMSLGYPAQSDNSVLELLMEQQMQDANAMGTLVVGSAGNAGSGDAGGPATSPGAEFSGFSIGASDENRDIAGFSSGAILDQFSVDYVDLGGGTQYPAHYPRQYVKPDVSAPGVGVLSSGPLGGDIGDPAATYSYSSGTSMAAPHVAGAVALVQSVTAEDLDPKLIESALAETAEKPDNDFPAIDGRDIRYGTGIINVTAATEAILDGNLTIEGQVTDSQGDPIVGATVESEDGALTSTDENGNYTLQTTSEAVNVTADAFGHAAETQFVDSDAEPVDFQLADTLAVDLVEGQPAFAAFDGGFNVTVDVANLENLTVDLTAESDVPAENVTVLLEGTELTLGETFEFDGQFTGAANLTVDIAGSGTLAEGDLLGLEHTFEGAGDSLTVETGPTEMTETLAPPEYELGNISAPSEAIVDEAIPVSVEITNVGQTAPDFYGYQFFATNGETAVSLPPSELNLAPGETKEISLSVAGIEAFYDAGEVLTHGFRVGELSEDFFGNPTLPPENVEDNITADVALQAENSQFNVAGLDAPLTADPGETIDVTATIASVGELNDTQTVEFQFNGSVVTSETVSLDAFELESGVDTATVTFENVTLPTKAAPYEHGVSTANDTATASIGVGVALDNVTLVRSGAGTGAADTRALFEESLAVNFAPVEVVDVANVTDALYDKTEVFVLHDLGDSPTALIEDIENDPTTGAVYLEQWTDSNAIADRVDVIGDPDESVTAFNSAPPAVFNITADHPIFDGVGSAGDTVEIHSESFSDIAWFNGADSETLATVSDQTGEGGPAVTVDPDSGSVLISTIAVTSSTPGLGDFSSDAGQILANAVDVATPEELQQPFFEVSDLTAPAEAEEGELINVSATITNTGSSAGTQDVEFAFNGTTVANETVSLNASATQTVTFTDVPLPEQTGVFEHGVFTANDSQTADIAVGDLVTVTVVETGDLGSETLSLFESELPDNFAAQVVDASAVTDGVVDSTDIFVFHDVSDAAASAERGPAADDITSAGDVSTDGVDIDTAELITTVENDVTTGAVYLDQWGTSSNAIPNRSSVLGDPAETFQDFQGSFPVEYNIQTDHPIFQGVGSAGDTVEIHTGGTPDITWFEGATGDTLATVQAGSVGGPAVAVDPNSNSVLLSSIAVTTFIGPDDYTTAAGQILANSVEVAQPPEISGPFFQVSNLTAPAQADPGATIDVSATITNIGNETGTQDIEFVFNGSAAATEPGVELTPGENTTVTFTDITLPEAGIYDHGVFSANNSATGTIEVGSAEVQLSNLTQPDMITMDEDITSEVTVTNVGTLPWEGQTLMATNLNGTEPDTGFIFIPANVTDLTLDPGESVTVQESVGTFQEINNALGTSFGPGDDVVTGFQAGQNLDPTVSPEPVVEDLLAEEISIVEEAPPEVAMSNLSIDGQGDDATLLEGDHNVTVEMEHVGGGAGEVTMNLTIGETLTSETVTIDVGETVTVTVENATSGVTPGYYDVTASALGENVSGSLTISVDATGNGEPATDTTGDGLLNDVDGDREFTIGDIQALFDALDSQVLQGNAGLFDFAGIDDDRVSIFDVQGLFTALQAQS